MPPIVVVSLVPAIANVLLIIAVIARHLLIGRRTRHVETLAARLRLPAVELVEGDGPIEPPELNAAEIEVFADLLVKYGLEPPSQLVEQLGAPEPLRLDVDPAGAGTPPAAPEAESA